MLSGVVLRAQTSLESAKREAQGYAKQIDTTRIRADLTALSSDAMEGRETAELGQKMAAAFIEKRMGELGLSRVMPDSSYLQHYPLFRTTFDDGITVIGDDTLRMLESFYTFSSLVDTSIVATELLFMGYGISDESYDNYAGVVTKGRAALIFGGEPMDGDISRISKTVIPTAWSDGYDAKVALASKKGISILFVVQEYFDKNLPRVTYYLKRPKLTLEEPRNDALPIIFISPDMVDLLLPEYGISGVRSALKSPDATYEISRKESIHFSIKKRVEKVQSENVVGFVKGSEYPEEFVVISGHYDHLGMKDSLIFNGADDNGSGTSVNLELMRIFAESRNEYNGPKRSVMFVFFSGEEKGLLGSSYFVDNAPVSLSQMISNLNVDMVGRRDASIPVGTEEYIYLIGSDKLSTELHEISELVNKKYTKLHLDYKFNDPNDPQRLYYRSDHYNFAKHGIPVIFYFRGLHEDYHKPTDTVEKIDFIVINQVSNLIFHTAWELANRKNPVRVDEALD